MSPARRAVNEAIVELSGGGKTLFVGVDKKWDYKMTFYRYQTMDIKPELKPDIVGDITDCPEIPDNSYDAVIMTGVYEYLDNPLSAFLEIRRILRPNGTALICMPGKAYYKDKPTMEFKYILEKLHPLIVDEVRIVYYRTELPYYFITRSHK